MLRTFGSDDYDTVSDLVNLMLVILGVRNADRIGQVPCQLLAKCRSIVRTHRSGPDGRWTMDDGRTIEPSYSTRTRNKQTEQSKEKSDMSYRHCYSMLRWVHPPIESLHMYRTRLPSWNATMPKKTST